MQEPKEEFESLRAMVSAYHDEDGTIETSICAAILLVAGELDELRILSQMINTRMLEIRENIRERDL